MKNLKSKLYKNLNVYLSIFTLNIIWQISGIGKVDLRISQTIDQQIMLLTSAKMHYFDYSSYEAAWNHHSPLLFLFTKVTYYFVNFNNSYLGFYILYSILLFSISILIYHLLFELLNNKIHSLFGSLIFIFDISSSTIGGKVIFDNRTLGILFQTIILINCLSYLKSNKNIYLYLISIFSVLQIYNLESYGITVLFIYVYLVYIEKNYIKFFTHSAIGSISTILYLSFVNNINQELDEFFDLNILFHLNSIGLTNKFENINLVTIFKNLFIGGNSNLSLFASLFIVVLVFASFLVKFKSNSIKENEKFIYVLLFGEIFHLYLTGPRFTSYSQILIMPLFVLFFIDVLGMFEKINKHKITGYFFFFLIFFIMQFGDVVLNRTSLIDGTFQETIDSYKPETSEPQLVLTWIGIDKYESVFFENNSLPSTRLWWWHQMKYVDKFYDKNYKMFDDELLENVFNQDIKHENPKVIIIDRSIIEPPLYFRTFIEINYQYTKTVGDIDYYRIRN